MICLKISIDEKVICYAGIENATLLTPFISSFVGDEYPALLDISGMCDLPGERKAHVYWLEAEGINLQQGSQFCIALIEYEQPTPPIKILATDSSEYMKAQSQFEEVERTFQPPIEPAIRRWPSVSFQCAINGEHQVTATLKSDEERLHCSFLWDCWNPEQCRISIRSFGGSMIHHNETKTEWLRTKLFLNDSFQIVVH